MRSLAAALGCLLFAAAAAAQDARRIAVLSLVGDHLVVVQRELTTGTRIDRNTRTPVPINAPALDNAMVLAVEREIQRADPSAQTVLLAARRPELYALQSRSLEEQAAFRSLVDAVREVAARANATHLVLATKHRGPARLQVSDGALGDGVLEGLGFYVDPTRPMEHLTAGQRSEGFIAPYAYFQLTLVDLESGAVLAQRTAMESRSAASQNVLTPWQALTAEQKAAMLETLIKEGAARAVPVVLKRG